MPECAFLARETPDSVREEILHVLAKKQDALEHCERGCTNQAVAMLRNDYPHVAFNLDLYSVNGACV
ncbi:hypothetical protein D3C85_1225840 [compost metagenome]